MINSVAFQLIPLFCLLPLASSYKATIVIGDVAQRDTSRPVYEVHFPQLGEYESTFNPRDDDIPTGMKTMRMVTARGQAMRCVLPESETPTPTPDPQAAKSDESRFDDIDDLLREYEDKCFVRLEGWWTYEFCYGKHIEQKHIIPKDRDPFEDEVEDVFVLGRYNRAVDLVRRTNASLVSTADAAFTQVYDNGTECDMTGNPRRTVVKFVCCDDALQLGNSAAANMAGYDSYMNILKSVREVESCVYEIEFMNAAICRHPTYKEKLARAARPIHCSVEDGGRAFEGLRGTQYQKASLSL